VHLAVLRGSRTCLSRVLAVLARGGHDTSMLVNMRDFYTDHPSLAGFHQTPAHYCAALALPHLLPLLAHHGARLDIEDCSGWSPLHHATARGCEDTVRALTDLMSTEDLLRLFQPKGPERAPLLLATASSNVHVVRLLLARAEDLCVSTEEGDNPLHIAAAKSSVRVLRMLLGVPKNTDTHSVDIAATVRERITKQPPHSCLPDKKIGAKFDARRKEHDELGVRSGAVAAMAREAASMENIQGDIPLDCAYKSLYTSLKSSDLEVNKDHPVNKIRLLHTCSTPSQRVPLCRERVFQVQASQASSVQEHTPQRHPAHTRDIPKGAPIVVDCRGCGDCPDCLGAADLPDDDALRVLAECLHCEKK